MRPVHASVSEAGRCALACDCVLCFVRRYRWAVGARSRLGEALLERCGPSMPRTQRVAVGTARQEAERLRQHCGIQNTTCNWSRTCKIVRHSCGQRWRTVLTCRRTLRCPNFNRIGVQRSSKLTRSRKSGLYGACCMLHESYGACCMLYANRRDDRTWLELGVVRRFLVRQWFGDDLRSRNQCHKQIPQRKQRKERSKGRQSRMLS